MITRVNMRTHALLASTKIMHADAATMTMNAGFRYKHARGVSAIGQRRQKTNTEGSQMRKRKSSRGIEQMQLRAEAQ